MLYKTAFKYFNGCVSRGLACWTLNSMGQPSSFRWLPHCLFCIIRLTKAGLVIVINALTVPPLGVDIGVGGVLLDEFAPWLYVIAHEHGEDLVGFCRIVDGHLLQKTCLRIHGRLP